MASGVAVGNSGNPDIDALLAGSRWDSTKLTFSFPTSESPYDYDGEPDSFQPFTEAMKDAVREALALISQYTNLTFTEILETNSDHADIRFGMADIDASGRGYSPGASADKSGDVWLYSGNDWTDLLKGGRDFTTILHEISHALGLSHPGWTMPADHVGWDYTIMSYQAYPGEQPPYFMKSPGNFPQTPMLADVAALQYLYGARFSTNSGNTTYRWSPTTGETFIDGVGQGAPEDNKIYMTLWDGGGIDTFDFSNYASDVVADLRPGKWSSPSMRSDQVLLQSNQVVLLEFADPDFGTILASGSIANPFLVNGDTRSLIENAVGGSGDDTLIGNQGNNVLTGNGGDDTFFYTLGRDTFNGGMKGTKGDTANFSMSLTGVVIAPVVSTMTIRLPNGQTRAIVVADGSPLADGQGNAYSVSYLTEAGFIQLADLHGIENITGSAFADTITGNGGDNVINALAGNDYVYYTGGFDTINGGTGTDTIDFSKFGFAVSVTLTTSTRSAEAFTSDRASILQWANLPGATMRPIAELSQFNNLVGTAFNDVLTGTTGDNILDGQAGNDTLYYSGGLDVLNGNFGNDTANFSKMTSAVFVDLAGGEYEAKSNQTADADDGDLSNIADLQGIENLIGTAFRDVLSGDAETNIINGGAGNDILEGRGGTDALNGGAGDDTYRYIGSWLGVDKIFDESGAHDKVIVGNLSNLTGAVRDGDDLIITMSTGQFRIVGQYAGHSIEHLQDATSMVMLATSGIAENGASIVAGTGSSDMLKGAGGDDTLYGNGGRDRLLGGSGNDFLDGGAGNDTLFGGAGDDTMFGGLGRDRFVFSPMPDGGVCGNDTIIDFDLSLDVIDLRAFNTRFRALDTDHDRVLDAGEGDGHISVQIDGNDTVLSFAEGSIRIANVVNLDISDFLL
jgi:serralysin